MRLILKLIAAPLILFPDCPCGCPAVPVLLVLLPTDSGLGHHGSAGCGAVLHPAPRWAAVIYLGIAFLLSPMAYRRWRVLSSQGWTVLNLTLRQFITS